MTEPDVRVSINGFGKDSTELIREMEDMGWTFRQSNHGVVGRAPEGKTTISVGRNIKKSNRSYQRAWGDFRRWLRIAHPNLTEIANNYAEESGKAEELAESEPIVAGILSRRSAVRSMEQITQLIESDPEMTERLGKMRAQTQPAQIAQTDSEDAPPMATATITDTEPWRLKKSKDATLRVLKRTWSNRRVDFICAYEGCPVTSANPRSITQHYGAVHTRAVDSYAIAAPKPAPEPEPTEPADGLPWEALAEMVEEIREAEPAPVPAPAPEPVITKQMIDVQYRYAEDEPMGDTEAILMEVQRLVSAPLLDRVKILAEQVNVLTKERDEAREQFAKIQSDWDALRSLLGHH